MGFSDIKGQPLAVSLLQHSLQQNRLASTYLFYGPRGVGKETTASVFAKALNCENLKDDACDKCNSCMRIGKKEYPDVLWISPEGASRSIKIEQVRQLEHISSWMPYEGKKKVSIIIDAENLEEAAGNALLKTLEEPSETSIFILISSQPEGILSTIRSRAQEIQFFNLSSDIIQNLLYKKMEFSKAESEYCSQFDSGSIEKALEFKNKDLSAQRKLILDIFAKGSFANMTELMDRISEILDILKQFKKKFSAQFRKERGAQGFTEEQEKAYVSGEYRKAVKRIPGLALSWYRDIIIFQATHNAARIINRDYLDSIRILENKFSINELQMKVATVEDIQTVLEQHINLKLSLQVMFIRLGLI